MTPVSGDLARAPRLGMGQHRLRFGDVLVAQGTITEDQLQQALEKQRETPPGQSRQRLGAVVVELGFASERQVAAALAAHLGLEVADLRRERIEPDVVRLLPQAVAQRGGVLVLGRTPNGLRIAVADPTNVLALDDVRLHTQANELVVLVGVESEIRDYLSRAWSLAQDDPDFATYLEELQPEQADEAALATSEDAPVVRLVNQMLADAVRARASDVHVQPEARELRIRYRVDGVLRDIMTIPKAAAAGLVSRVKVIAGVDIAERRLPQDGRIRLSIDGSSVDARVSTLPGLHGEKVVVRLLSRAEAVPEIGTLGFDPTQHEEVIGALGAPQGLVIITGPTGSGKTNTLYSAINHILSPQLNIITLEDPVEIQVSGITQVQINAKAGLTFARGLRSVLRQDPDVVLVGEVRDQETAKLALEASMTGHLVLTTLHTNNAPAALSRLVDMGVEPFLVASSLSLVVGQRLARRPCQACAEPYLPEERVLLLLGLTEAQVAAGTSRRGRGCSDCGGTGYRGRLGLFEVLAVTTGIRSVLLATPTEAAVASAARAAGMTSLRASALAAACRGDTTYEEVLRVTTAVESDGHRCPTCHSGLADDMVVCPWCETPTSRAHCEACARVLDRAWHMCPWCRAPVNRAPLTPTPLPRP